MKILSSNGLYNMWFYEEVTLVKAYKDLVQNTFILSRMLIEGYIVIFVEIYIYFMFMSIMSL